MDTRLRPAYDLATGLGAWSYTPGAPTGLTTTSASGGVYAQLERAERRSDD